MQELKSYPDILAAAEAMRHEGKNLVDLCIQIQQIPAPTGSEKARAAWVADALREAGLARVEKDEVHNVFAQIPGRRPAASGVQSLMVSAHTDTVFPADTDLATRWDTEEDRVYGPGIGDNSAGVAGLVALARALNRLPAPPCDIWLVANSGEEGLGDLCGMRAAVDRLQGQLGACIVIEGMGLGRIVHQALGSRRYRIRAQAPGGHSWSDFGTASALHALVRLAADLTHLKVPQQPRTAFNIGVLHGGRSINTIAQEAYLELDLRSEDPEMLDTLIKQVETCTRRYQTTAWHRQGVQVQAEVIGDRPSGQIPLSHPLVEAAQRALVGAGLTASAELRISSTDANIPLSRGIPAVCVGVTEGGNAHRLEEWMNPQLLPQGMQHLLLLTWWTALWVGGELN